MRHSGWILSSSKAGGNPSSPYFLLFSSRLGTKNHIQPNNALLSWGEGTPQMRMLSEYWQKGVSYPIIARDVDEPCVERRLVAAIRTCIWDSKRPTFSHFQFTYVGEYIDLVLSFIYMGNVLLNSAIPFTSCNLTMILHRYCVTGRSDVNARSY